MTKIQIINGDEVTYRVIRKKKTCGDCHKRIPIEDFGAARYCKPCMSVRREIKAQGPDAQIAVLVKRLAGLEKLFAAVFACELCQSKGYVLNHENKVFPCSCRTTVRAVLKDLGIR